MSKQRKVIYYEDELSDEFSQAQITPRSIDGNYQYDYSTAFKRFTHFFWYHIVGTPIAYLYMKTVFHHKIIGKNILKEYRQKGYFMYGNHTQDIGDAFIPTLLNMPKDNYCLVHPNNISMPILGKITPSLGAIPLPDDMAAFQNFMKVITKRILQKKSIVIYPEAHIWPFYTKIRPFRDVSFGYPIKYDVPAFCFTNTYQKRKFSNKPKIVTYIDGPFYPHKSLSLKAQKHELRNKVYDCMCKRAENSDLIWIEYIRKGEQNG